MVGEWVVTGTEPWIKSGMDGKLTFRNIVLVPDSFEILIEEHGSAHSYRGSVMVIML